MNTIQCKYFVDDINYMYYYPNLEYKKCYMNRRMHSNPLQYFIYKSTHMNFFSSQQKNNFSYNLFPKNTFKLNKDSIEENNYDVLKNKDVMIKTSRIILNDDIVIGGIFPVDVYSVRVVISDNNRNIIFQKDLGPAKKGENVFRIDSSEIPKKYLSSNDTHLKVFNFNLVAKTDTEIVPAISFTKGHVQDIFPCHLNDAVVSIAGLGVFSMKNILHIVNK